MGWPVHPEILTNPGLQAERDRAAAEFLRSLAWGAGVLVALLPFLALYMVSLLMPRALESDLQIGLIYIYSAVAVIGVGKALFHFSRYAYARHRLQTIARRSSETHTTAVEVLKRHYMRGNPFALFLRDFDWDLKRLYSGSDLDAKIQRAIERHMAIIGICDARNVLQFWRPEARGKIPCLILEDTGWEEVVTRLIADAAVLVVDCTYLSPGLERELEIISRSGRADSTVIVIPSTDDDALAGIPVLRAGADHRIESRNFAQATHGDHRIRGMAAVTREHEIPDDFAELPAIRRLLVADG